MEKFYLAIDLKSFYASVECIERGLDPFTTNLVVADPSRTDKTICLAVSPALRALGVPSRARLFEVKRIVRNLKFIIAPPRMKKYMATSTRIYNIYRSFIAPQDIHVYSIDEVFIDATSYLKTYHTTAPDLARTIIHQIFQQTGITATAGIGPNLYLAKIAMDILAKHQSADQTGARIAELDELTYRQKLWEHQPITDFWRIGRGYARRLSELGIHSMGDLALYSLTGSDQLYKAFGINAELLIDHAWGYEPVEMSDIKNYQSENHSLSQGQVLQHPYGFAKAKIVLQEMIDSLVFELVEHHLVTDQIVLTVCYDVKNIARGFQGHTVHDRYGRKVPKSAHGSVNLDGFTSSTRRISEKTLALFQQIASQDLLIRRFYLAANHVMPKNQAKQTTKLRQANLFTDYQLANRSEQREQKLQAAVLEIRHRFGKNSLLRALSLEDGATAIMRNNQVGGHRA